MDRVFNFLSFPLVVETRIHHFKSCIVFGTHTMHQTFIKVYFRSFETIEDPDLLDNEIIPHQMFIQ